MTQPSDNATLDQNQLDALTAHIRDLELHLDSIRNHLSSRPLFGPIHTPRGTRGFSGSPGQQLSASDRLGIFGTGSDSLPLGADQSQTNEQRIESLEHKFAEFRAEIELSQAQMTLLLSRKSSFARDKFQRVSECIFYTPSTDYQALEALAELVQTLEHEGLREVCGRTELGSLWRWFLLKTSEAVTSAEAKTIYKKAQRAAELRLIDNAQAVANQTNAQGIATLLDGLKNVDNLVLLHETFLVLKVTRDEKTFVYARVLT